MRNRIYRLDYMNVEVVAFKLISPDNKTEIIEIPQGEIVGNKIFGLRLNITTSQKSIMCVIGDGFSCVELEKKFVPISIIEELYFTTKDVISYWNYVLGSPNCHQYKSENILEYVSSYKQF